MTASSLLNLTGFLLAQTAELGTALGGIIEIVNLLAMVFVFFSLIVAAIMIMTGRNDHLGHLFVGILLAATAWLLVNALFGAAGTTATFDIGG